MSMVTTDEISLYDALKRMRRLTEIGVPFSFGFYSYNSTKKRTEGYKHVERAMLRQGLRKDQSDKSELLIGYTNYPNGGDRFFNLPLLMEFNGLTVVP